MTDAADDAFEITERYNREALRKQKELKKQNVARKNCCECGIELNEIRYEYGICVDCQEDLEKEKELRKRIIR